MRYLNRVIFINSANVKYAEIAIDGNVHFIGTQGVGKSTLLRAILFFYNADKLKLGIERGKKTFDEYYFPGGDSYVIYEVVRETGPYCIMAFKSQGRVCFRFINSEFELANFVNNGKVRPWDGSNGIRDSFGKKTGYTKKIDRYEEYRDIIYGNNSGLEKEFRKYSLIESKQYQNLPRTIQNVFLNSKLDAEFIKQTIIMSLNEEDVKIELDKYALHLKNFDTELADINKWTEVNKSGEIPVRKMAENIARLHAAIQSLNREKRETAIQLFRCHDRTLGELPNLEKQRDQQLKLRQTAQQKSDDLKGKFEARERDMQKLINILEYNLKEAKTKNDYYESINIDAIISRINKKDSLEAERERLQTERTLLNAKFIEINSRYNALIQQQQQAQGAYENESLGRKNKLREEFLMFKEVTNKQYYESFAEIRKQHQDALEVARNTISQQKEQIHELKLKKQKGNLKRYHEQDIEAVKVEIDLLNHKIKSNEVDIADYRKQVATLQKQFELESEKAIAVCDRNLEKMWEHDKLYQTSIAAINTKLQKSKDSLYSWLNSNMPGWEHSVGKVIDEDHVLFMDGLSPQLADGSNDTFFGLKLDLKEISTTVKTYADYEKERAEWLQKAEVNKANINKQIEERDSEANKLKNRYQARIKDLNNTRRQMEYELQRSRGQLQANEVKREDLIRKAAEEREQFLELVNQEIEVESEELIKEEKNLATIESGIQRQLDNKEKEQRKKINAEENRIKELLAGLEEELQTRVRETQTRIEEIRHQQTNDLKVEGADVLRLDSIEKELAVIVRELDFINENRDKVAEYNKDRKELLDRVDEYKTAKRLRESQLDNEQEKYNLQKQKIHQEIDLMTAEITDLNKRLAVIHEGLTTFQSFKQTDHYKEVAEYENSETEATDDSFVLKTLIDALHSRIYVLMERHNDLRSAITKFLSHFSTPNIFNFKSSLTERNEFTEFAEMLDEFLEENKIVQYEKRVNERFATLIRQIGKETNELTSKGGEIQKVITEINRDFEERNFAGVIKSIRLQLSESKNNIVTLLKAIKEFNDEHSMGLGVVDLFSTGDNESKNRKAISLLKEFAKEINLRKEKEIGLPDSFELQFRIVENENDSGWVEKLTNVGSEGTDILVKAMINIMLLNVFKDSASKRFKDFRMHCMMDEIGKLHPNNVKGILKFANDRNILLINSSPTSYNATDYRYTYLLSKDSSHVTTVKRLVKKGADL
jgi:hypothetical protein